ncbi:MAG: hypothetical protein AB2A00_16830 [Myxococcota bacterium]
MMRSLRILMLVLVAVACWRCLPFFFLGCFTGDALVETPEGPRRMDSLRVGDAVWSIRVGDGTRVLRRVQAVRRSWSFDLRHPVTSLGRMHGVTGSHPFFLPSEKAWLEAADLVTGHVLLTAEGPVALRDVHDEHAWLVPEWVYELTVEGPEHTFIADGVVVHNKSQESPDVVVEDHALCRCVAESAGRETRLAPCATGSSSGELGMDASPPEDAGPPPECCIVVDGNTAPLETLSCIGRGIRELQGLEGFNSLRNLDVSENLVENLAPLNRMLLTSLNASRNPISDIHGFALGFQCPDGTQVILNGTLLSSDDNDDIQLLRERGCVVTPASF